MEDNNPTPPAEGASETPKPADGSAKDSKPSVDDLLSAARGDIERKRISARDQVAASKSIPSSTPPAARVAPGASKAASTPTASVSKGVPQVAVVKPPAPGPLVESISDPPINKLRRRVIWATVAGFMLTWLVAFFRFFLARTVFEPSTVFRIGFPGDYGVGVDTKLQQQYRIWVVKNTERLFVIFARCTHLGCTPDWKESENKFKCPCHGSGYDSEGINFEGPAPRPMDRAEVSLDAEGQIVVNVGKLYEWQKGTEGQFDDKRAFISV